MATTKRGQRIDFRRSAAPEAERGNPNHRTLQVQGLAELLGSDTASFGGPYADDAYEMPTQAAPPGPIRGKINKSPLKTHNPYAGTSEAGE